MSSEDILILLLGSMISQDYDDAIIRDKLKGAKKHIWMESSFGKDRMLEVQKWYIQKGIQAVIRDDTLYIKMAYL